jgi:hypothetical protein
MRGAGGSMVAMTGVRRPKNAGYSDNEIDQYQDLSE